MIFNLRLGHACNSSSTHSIVPLGALLYTPTDNYEDGEFGWDDFVLVSPEAKMKYLAATFADHLDSQKITEITGITPSHSWRGDDNPDFGYVDHQSVMGFPYDSPHFDLFIKDLSDYLRRDDVVILGGNDNSTPGGTAGHFPFLRDYGEIRIRPDQTQNGERYWTIMNNRSGDRVRFSFDQQPLSGHGDPERDILGFEPSPPPPYGNMPELVDVKVTDYCPFDCPWCYMSSNLKGQHSDWETASKWLDALVEQEVFEIALGGGEPTLWPHLNDFVEKAKENGINVNITTKNLKWLETNYNRAEDNGISAYAISINNEKDFAQLVKLHETLKFDVYAWSNKIVTIQCIPAFCSDELIQKIIDFAIDKNMRTTFLGVKRVGRATEEQREDNTQWLDIVIEKAQQTEKFNYFLKRGIAIDTLMAQSVLPKLEELKVEPMWYETSEGGFSCYIDMVKGKLGTSSYVDDDMMIDAKPDSFIDAFHEAQRKKGIRV